MENFRGFDPDEEFDPHKDQGPRSLKLNWNKNIHH